MASAEGGVEGTQQEAPDVQPPVSHEEAPDAQPPVSQEEVPRTPDGCGARVPRTPSDYGEPGEDSGDLMPGSDEWRDVVLKNLNLPPSQPPSPSKKLRTEIDSQLAVSLSLEDGILRPVVRPSKTDSCGCAPSSGPPVILVPEDSQPAPAVFDNMAPIYIEDSLIDKFYENEPDAEPM